MISSQESASIWQFFQVIMKKEVANLFALDQPKAAASQR
jgi:hypothetical protein